MSAVLVVDASLYLDADNAQHVFVIEINRASQELTEDATRANSERHLAEASPIYSGRVKSSPHCRVLLAEAAEIDKKSDFRDML